jgi:mRNA interferase RelE/StbE
MASYRIEWRTSAQKELRRLGRTAVPRLISAIGGLAEDPFPSGCRKLHGSERTYRLRVGDYRVIYEVWQARLVIVVVRVRHRREAYR